MDVYCLVCTEYIYGTVMNCYPKVLGVYESETKAYSEKLKLKDNTNTHIQKTKLL